LKTFFVMSVAFMLLLINGCTGVGQAPELTIVSQNMTANDAGIAQVQVVVENTGTVTAELAQVKVDFYDAGKNLLGTSSESIMNLKPSERWTFNIASNGLKPSQVGSYQVRTMASKSTGGI
jgi:hypothetical protein